MGHKHPEVNLVIQPTAGIANYGLGGKSTASIHFALMRHALGKQLHVPVLEPLVPKGFGILGATAAMSEKFGRDLEHNLADYPNAVVLFIAHSFGGLLAREQLALHHERERFIGAITLGSPLRGVHVDKWKRFDSTVRTLNAFATDVGAMHAADQEQSPLTMFATTTDIMVPCESALPAIPDKPRHVFAHPGASTSHLGNVERHANLLIDHNGLVAHPHAIGQVALAARSMIKQGMHELAPFGV